LWNFCLNARFATEPLAQRSLRIREFGPIFTDVGVCGSTSDFRTASQAHRCKTSERTNRVNALQQKILDPFVVETLNSLTTLAGLPATAGEAFEDNISLFRFKGYAVATEVSGAVPGKVLLHLYPETVTDVGQRVFARMTGETSAEISTDDVHAALNEWANVLIGRATRALEIADLDVHFAPPFFVHDTTQMGALMNDVVEIVSVPIHTEQAGRFYFNYLLHSKTAGG
jgi:CheY-specific phosphatase CheX